MWPKGSINEEIIQVAVKTSLLIWFGDIKLWFVKLILINYNRVSVWVGIELTRKPLHWIASWTLTLRLMRWDVLKVETSYVFGRMRKMRGRGLISPPKSRFSVTESDSQNNAAANPPSMPNYMSATRRSTAARVVNPKQQQTTHTKPTFGSNAIRATKNSSPKPTPVVPSRRRPTWAPNNPNGHSDNSTTKLTTAKITTSRNSNVNGVQQQPRGPTLISVASGSSHGSGHHQDANNNNIEGEEEDSTTVIGHPHVINQLQQLSIDGELI